MAAPFRWDIKHFPTVAHFLAYLAGLPKPSWAKGVTLHHTYIPKLADWRGHATMSGMGSHYRNVLKWDSGPQIFVAPDGIWQGTPVNQPAVHAQRCNVDHIAIEVVGDYDKTPWAEPITSLVYGTINALFDWLDIPNVTPETLNGHRDCGSSKTCPGSAIDLDVVRDRLRQMRDIPHDLPVIGVRQSISQSQWLSFCLRNQAPLSTAQAGYLYKHTQERQIDMSFFGAVWIREGGQPLGSSVLQMQSKCPINIKAAPGEWRPTVPHKGQHWHAYEDFFSGALASIEHLKRVYGWQKRLHTVRAIAPVFMSEPNTTQAEVERYITSLLEDMQYMRSH